MIMRPEWWMIIFMISQLVLMMQYLEKQKCVICHYFWTYILWHNFVEHHASVTTSLYGPRWSHFWRRWAPPLQSALSLTTDLLISIQSQGHATDKINHPFIYVWYDPTLFCLVIQSFVESSRSGQRQAIKRALHNCWLFVRKRVALCCIAILGLGQPASQLPYRTLWGALL